MKKILLILTLLHFTTSKSQVAVDMLHDGYSRKTSTDNIGRFKKSETIFLFSDTFEKEVYEDILKKSWKVTPYKILSLKNFDINNYLTDNYSFATIVGFYGGSSLGPMSNHTDYLNVYFSFFMYNIEDKKKELLKLSKKSEKFQADYNTIVENRVSIARFSMFPKSEFIIDLENESSNKSIETIYNKDPFYNYKPGYLLNYLQKINQLLTDETTFSLYKGFSKPELAELKNKTLFIPEYVKIKYNGWTVTEKEIIVDLFEDYEFKYQYESDSEISKKIMNQENFYYLRFVRTNSERFLQIINSFTGEIIYSDYIPGLSYNLKPSHFKTMSKKIAKSKN